MEFEWDPAKSNACASRRGFDFAYAARAFGDPRRTAAPDERYDYGEVRCQLVGQIDKRVYVVVYTVRLGAIRIVPARKANKRVIQKYENSAH